MKAHRASFNVLAFWPALFLLTALFAPGIVQAVPIEVYGRLPALEDVSVSPDGSRIAFVKTTGDTRVIAVKSLADLKLIALLRVGNEKLRSVEWADDNHLLIVTSATALPPGLRGIEHEWLLLQIYEIVGRKLTPIPDSWQLKPLNVMNVISGRVMVRRIDGHTVLFVRCIYLENQTMPVLIRVDLETGRERVVRTGYSMHQTWLVDSTGNISAEQNYDDRHQHWVLKILRDGRLVEVASGHEAIDYPQMLGCGPTAGTLLMQVTENSERVWKLFSLKDGTFGPPMAEGGALTVPIEDHLSNCMIGGVRVDDESHYVFFDKKMQALWDAIVRAFNGDRLRLVSWSNDFKKIIVRVDGQTHGFLYELVDFNTNKAQWVGDVYEGLTEPLEVRRVTYLAADNLQIPAYLTLPQGRVPEKLPLIVLPHGGPAARSTADFDWWSQALADQGYAVLRPNYRGSKINQRFFAAGFGEYGRKMQTDLSDGVRYLVKEGIVDGARVCIVGASYGGYAALAGVTLDPGVYRCAVSVAGISDLKRMLNWVNEQHLLVDNVEQRYWNRFLGVTGPDDPLLEKISPIKHIDSLNVPVLLIHGRDDTVVPFEQSDVMFDALRDGKKNVEFVTLKHEDHWLSRSETRLQMLQATVAFLRAHNPPD